MTTHVALYKALEPHVGTEAAEMISEVVPPAAHLATKEDIRALEARIFRWGLAAVIPLWVGVWGAFVTLLIAVLTRRI